MASASAPALLHVVGYLTGASLYAMLLAMALRTRGSARRPTLGTAILGIAWNIGELATHGLESAGLTVASAWMAAVSYVALGFLAAVAVHAAGRRQISDGSDPGVPQLGAITAAGYGCAALAGAMHLYAAGASLPLPWPPALMITTGGLAVLSVALLLTTRRQPHSRRALWMTGLALFAVSALHLGRWHGASESWPTELLGHQASIPLAFAILFQDYRFGFVDLFLKRALTLLVLVTVVFIAWSSAASLLTGVPMGSPFAGVLLAMWVTTALIFPWLQRQISAFVDRVVLKRANYATLLDTFATTLLLCDSEDTVMARACELIGPALDAESVRWQAGSASRPAAGREIPILTAEEPHNVVMIGSLMGGRRLLSDDLLMLDRIARLAGRRIDAIRLGEERYELMLREREISALAVEAELRALRAQINPHFLFNALTTLGYLIQHAPVRALETLMRLTTLLRSVLRSEGEFTTLGHECELIECYLQIEQERFEERLETHIDVPAHLRTLTIPSLILQPLVENAIKHGIACAREGGRVVVSARLDAADEGLRILVVNTGAPLRTRASTTGGIGLENVERRLRGYYGKSAELTLRTGDDGSTRAELTLPASALADETPSALLAGRRR
jgi:hypothetical protein